MRILYVDVNARFVNPTRSLLPLAFGGAGAVDFFGPGFVTSEILDRGLRRFIDLRGPYDFVVATPHVLSSALWAGGEIPRSYLHHYRLAGRFADCGFLPAICKELAAVQLPRVAVLLESDLYNWDGPHIDLVERSSDYLLGFGPDLWRPLAELPDLAQEMWGGSANDRWWDLAKRRSRDILSLPHFVGEGEFWFRPFAERTREWAIPGAQYAARRAAVERLTAAQIAVRTKTPLYTLERLRRWGVLRNASDLVLDWLNASFYRQLRSASYVFTCGSGLRMPVRKFFEIPAAGALLVCRPCAGFDALGFLDGQNAIAADPRELPEIHDRLTRDPDEAESIARAGQQLVWRRHSLTARSVQIGEALTAIQRGGFAGSEWREGEFVIKRDSPAEDSSEGRRTMASPGASKGVPTEMATLTGRLER